ncbi:MAG: hypothetical protein ACXW04_12385 [Methylobacter sp.]
MSDLSEEHKRKIRMLWSQLPEYCAHIERAHSFRITELDLLLALKEATGKELKELALQEWSDKSIANTIIDTKIAKTLPMVAEEVVVMESVIPLDVIRNINEEHVKFKGEKWVVHKNDPDPFPSDPHAHNYEAGLKLHLGNVELYRGSKCVGKIPVRKFIELRSLFKSVSLPTLCC